MPHKILVVDDEHHVLDTITISLSNEPYTIITAESAEEALSILEKEPVDLILSDEMMPGMSGTDLLAIARKEYPDTVRMMFTAFPSLELAVKAINDGHVYHFFTKPFKAVDLIMTIRQALRHKDLVVESRRILNVVRKQNAVLRNLERKHSGITKVKRDEEGVVVIDDSDYVNWHELVEEMYKEVEKSEDFLHDINTDAIEE